jgi:hypothetical protein
MKSGDKRGKRIPGGRTEALLALYISHGKFLHP